MVMKENTLACEQFRTVDRRDAQNVAVASLQGPLKQDS